MKIFIRSAAAALALSLVGVSGAEAQLQSSGLYKVSPDCNFIIDVEPDATACSGAWSGNFKNQTGAVLQQIEDDGWGTGFQYSYGMDLDYEATSGTLNLFNPLAEDFILALRSANTFSLYRFTYAGTEFSAIDWKTNGTSVNWKGDPQALSGWGVYTVPEPGTVLLLGTGLLGMAFARRREDDIEA